MDNEGYQERSVLGPSGRQYRNVNYGWNDISSPEDATPEQLQFLLARQAQNRAMYGGRVPSYEEIRQTTGWTPEQYEKAFGLGRWAALHEQAGNQAWDERDQQIVDRAVSRYGEIANAAAGRPSVGRQPVQMPEQPQEQSPTIDNQTTPPPNSGTPPWPDRRLSGGVTYPRITFSSNRRPDDAPTFAERRSPGGLRTDIPGFDPWRGLPDVISPPSFVWSSDRPSPSGGGIVGGAMAIDGGPAIGSAAARRWIRNPDGSWKLSA